MSRIEKKTWPDQFEAIVSGRKTFDVRLADFDIKEGDVLVLREWDPKTKQYTGRSIEKDITYVLDTKKMTFWPKEQIEENGLLVLGFK